jgi:hypothetical protein
MCLAVAREWMTVMRCEIDPKGAKMAERKWAVLVVAGVLALASGRSAHAGPQVQDEDHVYYEVAGLVYVLEFNEQALPANRVLTTYLIPRPPLQFNIVGTHNQDLKAYYIIQFTPIKSEAPEFKRLANYSKLVNQQNSTSSFAVDQGVFQDYVNGGYIVKKQKVGCLGWRSVVYGATLALPFKLRPYDEDTHRSRKLTTDVTLGGYVAFEWRLSPTRPFYLDAPMASAGLTLLPINAATTKDSMPGDGTVPGVYWSLGAVVKLDNFQLGVMVGRDYAEGDLGSSWVYNAQTWYSFTIGYSFLNESVKKDSPPSGPKPQPST